MTPDSRIPLRSGREMPVMGLGTWKLTRDTAETVQSAIEAGYRMIDTAVDYGSQPGIGAAIQASETNRDALYLVTKIEETDDPMDGVRRDLGELQLEYADLTLIHRPPPDGPGEALWRGLMQARDAGLVRDIGVSNYSADLIDRLADATGEMPAVNQVEWSPFGHDERLIEHHRGAGIVLQAYSPLTRAERLEDAMLIEIGRRHGKTPAQVLVRWNLQKGSVPLPKANHEAHFRENLDVFDFDLDERDLERLDGLNDRWSALGSLPYV